MADQNNPMPFIEDAHPPSSEPPPKRRRMDSQANDSIAIRQENSNPSIGGISHFSSFSSDDLPIIEDIDPFSGVDTHESRYHPDDEFIDPTLRWPIIPSIDPSTDHFHSNPNLSPPDFPGSPFVENHTNLALEEFPLDFQDPGPFLEHPSAPFGEDRYSFTLEYLPLDHQEPAPPQAPLIESSINPVIGNQMDTPIDEFIYPSAEEPNDDSAEDYIDPFINDFKDPLPSRGSYGFLLALYDQNNPNHQAPPQIPPPGPRTPKRTPESPTPHASRELKRAPVRKSGLPAVVQVAAVPNGVDYFTDEDVDVAFEKLNAYNWAAWAVRQYFERLPANQPYGDQFAVLENARVILGIPQAEVNQPVTGIHASTSAATHQPPPGSSVVTHRGLPVRQGNTSAAPGFPRIPLVPIPTGDQVVVSGAGLEAVVAQVTAAHRSSRAWVSECQGRAAGSAGDEGRQAYGYATERARVVDRQLDLALNHVRSLCGGAYQNVGEEEN